MDVLEADGAGIDVAEAVDVADADEGDVEVAVGPLLDVEIGVPDDFTEAAAGAWFASGPSDSVVTAGGDDVDGVAVALGGVELDAVDAALLGEVVVGEAPVGEAVGEELDAGVDGDDAVVGDAVLEGAAVDEGVVGDAVLEGAVLEGAAVEGAAVEVVRVDDDGVASADDAESFGAVTGVSDADSNPGSP